MDGHLRCRVLVSRRECDHEVCVPVMGVSLPEELVSQCSDGPCSCDPARLSCGCAEFSGVLDLVYVELRDNALECRQKRRVELCLL